MNFACWKQVKLDHAAQSVWVTLLSKSYNVALFLVCERMLNYWIWISIRDIWRDVFIASVGVCSRRWCALPWQTAGPGVDGPQMQRRREVSNVGLLLLPLVLVVTCSIWIPGKKKKKKDLSEQHNCTQSAFQFSKLSDFYLETNKTYSAQKVSKGLVHVNMFLLQKTFLKWTWVCSDWELQLRIIWQFTNTVCSLTGW